VSRSARRSPLSVLERVSPEATDDQFVAIARIVKPQGRRGEVMAEMLTDFPERFLGLNEAYLEAAGREPARQRIEETWPHKGRIVLKFSGVDSIAEAARLRGLHVFIRRQDRMVLPEHQYYVSDLEGCRVIREADGAECEVGIVTEVERTGGTDVLHVASASGSGAELLIPLAQEICKRIDTAAKRIWIDPPEELLELNHGLGIRD